MKNPFSEAVAERILLADGAMGTELYSRGIPLDRCYEELNLTCPQLVREIHQAYLEAGAEIIETNTFGANAIRLARYGLEKKAREINLRAAEIAREASQGEAYIAGSVGPAQRKIAPSPKIGDAQLYDAFACQVEALRDGGVELIVLETFSDLEEAGIAYRAARGVSNLPIIVQFPFHSGGSLTPEETIKAAEEWGADATGSNCSGPEETLECIQRMARVSSLRLSAMPSAGLPTISGGRATYPASLDDMACLARRLIELGVSLIGGCCGTTPAMIREMGRALRGEL